MIVNLTLKSVVRGLIYTTILAYLCASLMGCQSKYSETEPSAVPTPSVSLEDRIKVKTRTDDLLDRASTGLTVMTTVVGQAQELTNQKPQLGENNAVAIFEIFSEMAAQLTKPLPIAEDGAILTEVKLNLQQGDVSDECRAIDVRMALETKDKDGAEVKPIGIITARGCGTDSEFREMFRLSDSNGGFQFDLNTDNIQKLFKSSNEAAKSLDTSCNAKYAALNSISDVTCSNIILKANSTDTVLLETLAYNFDHTNLKKLDANWALLENGKRQIHENLSLTQDDQLARTPIPDSATDSSGRAQ